MKFRKKPIVIEALKFMGGFSVDEMGVEWGDSFCEVARHDAYMNHLMIKTLEGVMTANRGDYVIRGIAGEFYPCKSDIFEKTYEPVEIEKTYNRVVMCLKCEKYFTLMSDFLTHLITCEYIGLEKKHKCVKCGEYFDEFLNHSSVCGEK